MTKSSNSLGAMFAKPSHLAQMHACVPKASIRKARLGACALATSIMEPSILRVKRFKSLLDRKPENWRELLGLSRKTLSSLTGQMNKALAVTADTEYPLIEGVLSRVRVLIRDAEMYNQTFEMIYENDLPRAVVFCDFCATEARASLIRYELKKDEMHAEDPSELLDLAIQHRDEVGKWAQAYQASIEENSWEYPEVRSRKWKSDFIGPEAFASLDRTMQEEIRFYQDLVEQHSEIDTKLVVVQSCADKLLATRAEFREWLEEELTLDEGIDRSDLYTTKFSGLLDWTERMNADANEFLDATRVRVSGKEIRGNPDVKKIYEDILVERKMAHFLSRAVTPDAREDFYSISPSRDGRHSPSPVPLRELFARQVEIEIISKAMQAQYTANIAFAVESLGDSMSDLKIRT